VEAPKQQQQPTDLVKNVFDQALKHGAIAKHDEKTSEKEKFVGSGFVLGNTEKQSAVVSGATPKPLPVSALVLSKKCNTSETGFVDLLQRLLYC